MQNGVCHAGIGSVRCKWGSVQEATALWEFMHAVPQGALEEIGLCRVDPAVLQNQYGFAEGQLPPMGASPDGLIRQRQASPASSVQPIALLCACRAEPTDDPTLVPGLAIMSLAAKGSNKAAIVGIL